MNLIEKGNAKTKQSNADDVFKREDPIHLFIHLCIRLLILHTDTDLESSHPARKGDEEGLGG